MDDGVEGVAWVLTSKIFMRCSVSFTDSSSLSWEFQKKESIRMQNGALTQACCSEEVTPKSVTIVIHKIVKYSYFWSFSDFDE